MDGLVVVEVLGEVVMALEVVVLECSTTVVFGAVSSAGCKCKLPPFVTYSKAHNRPFKNDSRVKLGTAWWRWNLGAYRQAMKQTCTYTQVASIK